MAASVEQAYCVDTSALIEFKVLYPITTFPGLWKRLETLIDAQRLMAPHAVFEEIERGDDELVEWARRHRAMFRHDTEDLVLKVSEILERFPDLVDESKEVEDADPWVVALAVLEDGLGDLLVTKRCAVITQEHRRMGRSRIPHVCAQQGIECFDWREVFKREGWKFE